MGYEEFDFEQPPHEDTPIILPPVESSHNGLKIAGAVVLVVAVAATGYLVFRNRQVAAPPSAPAARSSGRDRSVQGAGRRRPRHESAAARRERRCSARPGERTVCEPKRGCVAHDPQPDSQLHGRRVQHRRRRTSRSPGDSPETQGAFQVEERGEDLFINSRGYSRYLPLATAASSVNPEDAAKLYTTLKPRIDEAYAELGQTGTTFDQTLERAIVLLLKTPVPEGRVPVEPNGAVGYRFANPVLEKLTPTQKLLIRFGPDSQRAVQTSLRNIALALGIPADRLP